MILRSRLCQDVVKTRYIKNDSDFRRGSLVTRRSNLSPRGNGRTGKFLHRRSVLRTAGIKLRLRHRQKHANCHCEDEREAGSSGLIFPTSKEKGRPTRRPFPNYFPNPFSLTLNPMVYLRRRANNNAAPPSPASASVVGSGTTTNWTLST